MSVSIRLSLIGTKHVPFFRIVVVDSRKKRDGAVLENIGTYDGLKTKLVTFRPERYDAWVKLGAQPSDTAKKIYRLFKQQGDAAKLETAPKKTVAAKKVETKTTKQVEKTKPAEQIKAAKTSDSSDKDAAQE